MTTPIAFLVANHHDNGDRLFFTESEPGRRWAQDPHTAKRWADQDDAHAFAKACCDFGKSNGLGGQVLLLTEQAGDLSILHAF